jgi:hypothetical protein
MEQEYYAQGIFVGIVHKKKGLICHGNQRELSTLQEVETKAKASRLAQEYVAHGPFVGIGSKKKGYAFYDNQKE